MANRVLYLLAGAAALVLVAAHVVDHEERVVHRPAVAALTGDPLFFDMEIRGPHGTVVSHPQVLGEAGHRTRVQLMSPVDGDGHQALEMGITLDPVGAVGGLDMSINVSMPGLAAPRHARLRMPMGEARTVEVPTHSGTKVGLTVLAYRVGSPAFKAYLRRLKARRGPEA